MTSSDLALWLTAVFTGLLVATAVVAGVIARRTLSHDRLRAGVGPYVLATRIAREDYVPLARDCFPPLPAEWKLEDVRYFPVRLANLADFATSAFLQRSASSARYRLGRVQVDASDIMILPSRDPRTTVVVIHRDDGWPQERVRVRARLEWRTNSCVIKFRRRVLAKPLPSDELWARVEDQQRLLADAHESVGLPRPDFGEAGTAAAET